MKKIDDKNAGPARLPPMKALVTFDAVVRQKSFSKAADELCVTQSAVSHQIKLLEEFVGQALLHRSNKHIALTQEGDMLHSVARDCFQRLGAVTGHLVRREAAPLKIMAQTSIAVDWLCPRLSGFTAGHEAAAVSLDMASYAASFDAQDYDVVIGTWPTPDGFVTERLRSERWFPVCTPDLLSSIDPSDPVALLGLPLYSSEKGEDWALWLQQMKLRRPPQLNIQVFGLAILATKAALDGRGVALSCGFMVDDMIARGQLAAIPSMTYELPWGHYHVHYRRDSHVGDMVAAFVDWLGALCRVETPRPHDGGTNA